ncbi:hypothetical protein ACFL4G_10300 [Thermodesulfobacteriota bacterium]
MNPFVYRSCTIAIFITVALALFRFITLLTRDHMAGFLGGFFFMVFPGYDLQKFEAPNIWRSLGLLFVLTSMIQLEKSLHRTTGEKLFLKLAFISGSLFAAVLALLSGVNAYILPVLVFWQVLISESEEDMSPVARLARALLYTIPFAVATAYAMVLLSPHGVSDGGVAMLSNWANLRIIPYYSKVVLTMNQGILRSMASMGWSGPLFWPIAIGLAALCVSLRPALAWIKSSRHHLRTLLFSLVLILIAPAVFLGYFPDPFPYEIGYQYTTFAGYAMLLAVLGSAIVKVARFRNRPWRAALAAVSVSLIFYFGILAYEATGNNIERNIHCGRVFQKVAEAFSRRAESLESGWQVTIIHDASLPLLLQPESERRLREKTFECLLNLAYGLDREVRVMLVNVSEWNGMTDGKIPGMERFILQVMSDLEVEWIDPKSEIVDEIFPGALK